MATSEKRFPFVPFLINLLIPLVYVAVSSRFRSPEAAEWFEQLNKPSFHPSFTAPGWARSLISFTIGIAAFMVWRRRKQVKHYTGLIISYFLMLTVNVTWAITFFSLHDLLSSVILSGVLVFLALNNLRLFYQARKLAFVILLPYTLWLVIIFYTTLSIIQLN